MKVNFDGATFANVNKSGIGVVVRNSNGLVIASLAQQVPQSYKVVDIEALAAAWALELGLEICLDPVIVEGDSNVTMKALATETRSLASFDVLIQDAKIFSNCYSKLLYSHTKRDSNKVAHSLARLAINFLDYIVWMEDFTQVSHVL